MHDLNEVVERLDEVARIATRERFDYVQLRQCLVKVLDGLDCARQSLDEQSQTVLKGALAGWDGHARTVLGH